MYSNISYKEEVIKMTKKEYLLLKDTPISEWSHEQCSEADRLIKEKTLKNIRKQLLPILPKDIFSLVMMTIVYDYNCGEVCEFLMNRKAYPEWMYLIKD